VRNGFRVIDSDRHVLEPTDIWDRYLDKRFRHYDVRQARNFMMTSVGPPARTDRATFGASPRGAPRVAPTQKGFARTPFWRKTYKRSVARGFDSESYLYDMDRQGVDVAVCFTGMGLYATWSDDMDPALSEAICRGYNNWLYDYMSANPDRLKGVCLAPFQDLDRAEREITRAARDLGMVGLFWRPNPHMGRLLSHPDLDRIYARCEELSIAICIHEGAHSSFPWFGTGRTDSIFEHHMTCHPFEQMGAFLSMAASGVFDRFPRLRVGHMESGAGWAPYWAERLDALHSNPLLRDGYRGRLKPSEYWRSGRVHVSCEGDDPTNATIGRILGEDCLLWASDYPHLEAIFAFREALDHITTSTHEGMTREFVQKILWDNPARFYGIERRADT